MTTIHGNAPADRLRSKLENAPFAEKLKTKMNNTRPIRPVDGDTFERPAVKTSENSKAHAATPRSDTARRAANVSKVGVAAFALATLPVTGPVGVAAAAISLLNVQTADGKTLLGKGVEGLGNVGSSVMKKIGSIF